MAAIIFNRNISHEAHDRMRRLGTKDLRVVAFHPGGGWTIVNASNQFFARSIPDECYQKMLELSGNGHQIRGVAFPTEGGNRWSLVTDKTFFNRNIPEECHQKMGQFHQAGHVINCVAFPPGGGNRWSVITNQTFFNRNIPDECHDTMRSLASNGQKPRWVSFPPGGGNRWSVLAGNTFFNRNIPDEAHQKMGQFHQSGHIVIINAFDPDGNGWSVVANGGAALVRRNVFEISDDQRLRLRNAILELNSSRFYPDGVSYWDKQDAIHQATHVHDGPSSLPWHRELCNRFEELLRQVDPMVALHYWDWTKDPRGGGGQPNLFSTGRNGFMGSASGPAGPPLQDFPVTRSVGAGAPAVPADDTLTAVGANAPEASQFQQFRLAIENAHDSAHGYIGGTIGAAHSAFEDPFVFLLHANVDRLFARWQRVPGRAWRLDPNRGYGAEENTTGAKGILTSMEPWAGGSNLRPWTPQDGQIVVKNSRDYSVVAPPIYDTDI